MNWTAFLGCFVVCGVATCVGVGLHMSINAKTRIGIFGWIAFAVLPVCTLIGWIAA
jgi:hypothetical protein